jgi:OOP family OmpA-OmpF porin
VPKARLPRAFARPADRASTAPAKRPPVQRLATPWGVLRRGQVLRLTGLRFAINRSRIRRSSFAMLDRLAKALTLEPRARLEIRGHIAWRRHHWGRRISQRRACSVRRYLISKGVAASQLTCKGYGDNRPLVPGRTPAARARNRRIEIVLLR